VGYDDRYDPDTDFDRWYTKATGAAILRWMEPGDTVLEFGCATGAMTAQFVSAGTSVTAVDRSAAYLERAVARGLTNATFVQGDISRIEIGDQFRHVVAANVAHEVPDLDALLANCRRHLAPGGYVHLSLQNPQSLHRLVGFAMGMIADLREISPRGEAFETLRLLDAGELADAGARAGLRCIHREGVMVKPLANAMMADLADEILDGFVAISHALPDHCAMNYLVFE